MNVELLAQILHSATSQIPRICSSIPVTWQELTEENKLLSIAAVNKIVRILREGAEIPKLEPVSEEETFACFLHHLWMKQALDCGWVYGENYSSENKTHPSIIPYSKLPSSERYKDIIWASLVTSFEPYIEQQS